MQNPSKLPKNNSQGIIFAIISCQRVPSFRFLLQGNIRQNHPCGNHPFANPRTIARNEGFLAPRRAPTLHVSAVNQRGRERNGAPRNHPEISSQKLADFECRFPYDSYGKNRGPFWPFLSEGFWGNIRRPLLLPAPLFYC